MVKSILCNLANHDSFWAMNVDCCGKSSIDPIFKFLAAMKLICYGVFFQNSMIIIRWMGALQKCALKNFVKALSGVLKLQINT